jgi:hypothetical protein
MDSAEDNQLLALGFLWQKLRAMDQAMHSQLMEHYPRTMSIVVRILESLFEDFGRGAFEVLAGLLLVTLVAAKVLPVVMGFSLGVAWIIAFVWLAQLKPVKDLTVISRWIVVLIGGTVFAFAAYIFGSWAFHQMK